MQPTAWYPTAPCASAFPELKEVPPADPSPLDTSTISVEPPDSKEAAIAEVHAAVQGRDLWVYTHGATNPDTGHAGAAPFAVTCAGLEVVYRSDLGDAARRHARDAALAAVILAVEVAAQCPRATLIAVLVRDRSALAALARTTQPHPLARLLSERAAALRSKRRSLQLRVLWAPKGAGDLDCIDRVHEEAAAAGRGLSTPLPRALRSIHDLPVDSTVLLTKCKERLAAEWARRWKESPQGSRMIRQGFVDPPGERVTRSPYPGLSRQQASLLTQLRCGHVALNAYLARIRAVDSPLCSACQVPETPAHFLFTCRRFTAAHHDLRREVGGPLTFESTLNNADTRKCVLAFISNTGRFRAYDPPPHS